MTAVCVLCPNFVCSACETPLVVADGLFVFIQDNEFRVALDDAGQMIKFYEDLTSSAPPEARHHLAHWIIMLSKTAIRSVEYVKVSRKSKDFRKFSVNLLKSIKGGAFYIVWTRQDYSERHFSRISSTILERQEALCLFRIGPQKPRTTEEMNPMIDLIAAGTAIKVAADAIGLLDKISKAYGAFAANGKVITINQNENSHHGESIKLNDSGTALVHQIGGHEVKAISRDELTSRLSESDLEFIRVYEIKLEQLFGQWAYISRQYENAGVGEQAKLSGQIKELSEKMKICLNSILKFTEKLGFKLGDHYLHIREITESH